MKYATREEWLIAAREALSAAYFGRGPVPALPADVRCSCGWARGSRKAIGQCFPASAAADGATHVFVCPSLGDPVRVLDVLLHELVHAAVGTSAGHKSPFATAARCVGLAGKPTHTYAEPGGPLHQQLAAMSEVLGAYPHAAVTPSQAAARKKAARKNVRLYSASDPDYSVTIAVETLAERGAPLDPDGEPMVAGE